MRIDIDPDCLSRYFANDVNDTSSSTGGTSLPSGKIIKTTPKEFLEYIASCINSGKAVHQDGYAPFCKHIFVPNPYQYILPSAVRFEEHKSIVQTDYIARRPNELPVLTRFVKAADVSNKTSPAKFIDCILYSRDQMLKEYTAMKMDLAVLPKDADWLIISLKYQNEDQETPMQPITMLRNTLIEEGGSGVGLDRDKYLKSVQYWKEHVEIL